MGSTVPSPPLARKIDRQPSHASDVATQYLLRFVCRADDETRLRTLLIHLLRALPLSLHALQSEDLNTSGKVEMRATLLSSERQNAMREGMVQRLGLESGLSVVSWELAPDGVE